MPTSSDSNAAVAPGNVMQADVDNLVQRVAARIRSRVPRPDGAEVMEADLVISFKVFRERFGSRVVLWLAESQPPPADLPLSGKPGH
mgnify:CR=1 FL=1